MPELGFTLGSELAPSGSPQGGQPGNRLETLLSILVAPFQDVENAFVQLYSLLDFTVQTGVTLDAIGKLVGRDRGGASDITYRRYIAAKIFANRSTGRREEIIKIARLVMGADGIGATVVVRDEPPAAATVRIDGVALDPTVEAVLTELIGIAAPNGVRIIVQSSSVVPALAFCFAGGTGLGFDNSVSPGSGGALADARDNVGA